MKNLLRPAMTLFALLTLITGVLYPMIVTGVAKVAFPEMATGSLLIKDGTPVGSRLIGQNFTDPGHFWSRPSATAMKPYNAEGSGGSNLGPLNPALTDVVKARIEALKAADPDNSKVIPVDLITASASGLDPHISPAAANYQLERVARVRKLSPLAVKVLVDQYTEGRQWGIFGDARIKVLELNLALDATVQ